MKDAIEKKLDEQIPEKIKSAADKYDEELKTFGESLEKITSTEELEKLETEVVKEIDENNERLAKVEYTVPDYAEFRGTKYTVATAAEYIADLLNKQTVNWQMTLGLFDVIDFWKKISKNSKASGVKVPYSYYSTTLNLLGQQQYKGYLECMKVLIVNALFVDARDAYLEDLSKTYFLAGKHDAIITRIEAIHAINTPGAVGEKKEE